MSIQDDTTRALVNNKKQHEDCPYDGNKIKYYVEKKLDERKEQRKNDIKWLIGITAPLLLAFTGWLYYVSVSVYILEERVVTIEEIRDVIREGNQLVIGKLDDHEDRIRDIERSE